MTGHLTHLRLSWHEIEQDCRQLAHKLAGFGPFQGMVAVTRGGMIPAGLLSSLLDIRYIETICVSSYDERQAGSVTLLKSLSGTGEGWLVVDDLVDSGATYRALRPMLPHAHFATLYAKPDGESATDSYVRRFAQSDWLIFPWELESQ